MSQATYVEISFREAGELFLFEAGEFALSTNDSVVVDTEHGPALGTVKRVNPESNSAPTMTYAEHPATVKKSGKPTNTAAKKSKSRAFP
jgi:cell fate regulator YaaT (PSP1 superfamily)